ncbi:hypothetical protein BD408DRAFT_429839 [Parasitella parasitica]|nr:hypothetical protein BD408DRAFT_429839 [Parasitella parasitica]
MRHLFDSRKENKSIKLVKKLQEEADKEWENEIVRRKEQELNDEAIAKELQAQLEHETNSDSAPRPPPLPIKPRQYNSSINISDNAASSSSTASHSTKSLPTHSSSSSFTIKPLYSISSADSQQPALPPRDQNANKKPVKSYLQPERYKPELQFSLASPTPSPSSVFYEKTPKLSPAISPLPALETAKASTPSIQNSNEPLNIQKNYDNGTCSNNSNGNNVPPSPIVMQPSRPAFNSQPPRPLNRMEMPFPTDVNPANFRPIAANHSAPSLYNDHHHHSEYPPNKSDPIVLPLSQQPQQHYNTIPAAILAPPPSPLYQKNESDAACFPQHIQQQQQSYPYQPMRQNTPSPAISLPFNSNAIYHHSKYSQQPQQQPFQPIYQATPPPQPQYQSTKPSFVPASSSGGFQLPSMPTSASFNNAKTTTKQNSTFSPTNPYYKKQDKEKSKFSNSTISLKPDEEQPHEHEDEGEDEDDWDNVNPERKTSLGSSTPVASTATPTASTLADVNDDDKESEIDYSDMIYDRRNESTEEGNDVKDDEDKDDNWEDTAVDPFDDDFAIHVSKESMATSAIVVGDSGKQRASSVVTNLAPAIQILDPTLAVTPTLSLPLSISKIAVEKRKPPQDKVEDLFEGKSTSHQYVEKESEEIEHRPIALHSRRQSMGAYLSPSTYGTPIPGPSSHQPLQHQYQHQQLFYNNRPQSTPLIELDLQEDEQSKVYPTNTLKAGAPPSVMSPDNPYVKKQGIVPATDYGYFKEGDVLQNKTLPELPKTATTNDDRHITISSISPGQRVWIRIHPTDTGKDLAERIHIVASYQTRRVTKITTKNGRSVPLDNKPVFEDWNEIINFKEGEQWIVEWEPIEHPYVDIITEGKEFMRQLKANFRGSSSSK